MGFISSITGSVKDFFGTVAEGTFANAGAASYVAAAGTIAALNSGKESKKLDDQRKELLRRDFGNLVDQVDIVFNAKMIELTVLGKQIGTNPAAQTFGKKVYVQSGYKAGDRSQLELLAHEFIHVRQYVKEGGLYQFGKEYFEQYYRASFDYANNNMEEEADRFANCFMNRFESTVKHNLVYESDWRHGWTTIIPYKIAQEVYALLYALSTGKVTVIKFQPGAVGFDRMWEDTWSEGWSSIMPYILNGAPHCVAYKVGNGKVKVLKLTTQAPVSLWDDNWSEGWTSFMPFELNSISHYLSYKIDTGRVRIGRLTDKRPLHIWDGDWSDGWTNFMPFGYNNAPHYLAYKRGNGTVHLTSINSDGKGTTMKWEDKWSKGWTNFVSLSSTGRDFIAYKGPYPIVYSAMASGNGLAHVSHISSPSQKPSVKWCNIWRGTWQIITSFEMTGDNYFLLYGAEGDEVKVYRYTS